jgi:potassium voltage-gated channel Eag-related subfamily H protein 8
MVECFTSTSFSTVCSSDNYDPDFRAIKTAQRPSPFSFTPRAAEAHDVIFTMDEHLAALDRCRNMSPGPDDIQDEMLSHLQFAGKEFLLSVYSRIWTESLVPDAWKEAFVIPVLKPGTDRPQATIYRPISLTSCLCKTTERMMNRRLVWVLESRNFPSGAAHDHLVILECHIQSAFLLPEHLIAVLFDLEKAYDATWRYCILRTPHRWNIRSRLQLFISQFLQARYFRFRLGVSCLRVIPKKVEYHKDRS